MGAIVDAIHALLMVVWVAGLPLLFWHRWIKLTKIYATFAIVFIILSQGSHYLLGECFLTRMARYFWLSSGESVSDEWFTVRFAKTVFNLIPTHREISIAFEIGMLLTIAGNLYIFYKKDRKVSVA